jgi:hypothetical protein
MDVLAGRADAPEPLELPAHRPRPAQRDHTGALVRPMLDEELVTAPNALGIRHGAHISSSTTSRGRREVEAPIGRCVSPCRPWRSRTENVREVQRRLARTPATQAVVLWT